MSLFGGGLQTRSAMHSGTNHELGGIWGSSGGNVFAVAQRGTILHRDGNDWPAMSSGANGQLDVVRGSHARAVGRE